MASIVFYAVSIAVAIAVGVLRYQSLAEPTQDRSRSHPDPQAIEGRAPSAGGAPRKAA